MRVMFQLGNMTFDKLRRTMRKTKTKK